MFQVWRYEIDPVDDVTELSMPKGATILHMEVPNDGDPPSIWVQVELFEEYEQRRFTLVATGMPLPTPCQYVGTAIMDKGIYVFHVYEIFENSR